ncbi:MAG: hypothetical protein Q8M94_16285 [Ignavibacteria bacterium]|nr:hypothetical protein [Ignavibacteria bacterium]
MKYLNYLLLTFVLGFISCNENSIEIDTTKDTYHDDIADITFINDHFYSTNYDLSGNAGSQIDLLKFSTDGKNIDDAFDLGMNGQGYLAITNDGTDVYLQSINTSSIIKYSLIGERIYMKWDGLSGSQWQESGLCYIKEADSLLMLYKNLKNPIQYRARTVSKQNPDISGSDIIFDLDSVDTTNYGVYAVEYFDSSFYMLGVNRSGKDILVISDYNFSSYSIEEIQDSTVVGLCFKGNDLYFSYRNRIIKKWKSY